MTLRPWHLALVLALAACDRLTPPEKETVRRWLLCEECLEGEQDSVLALGERAVGELRGALQGPRLKRQAYIRRQTEAMHARITPGRIGQQAYVQHFVGNYVATYQSRAALALARLNTPKAHAGLLYALFHEEHYRPDVRRVLGETARITLTPVAGDTQYAPVDSFVKVDPMVLVWDSVRGRPLPNFPVLFRVEAGNGAVIPSVRRTNSDGVAAVRWKLGPSDSLNVLRAVAAGQLVRFSAIGSPLGQRLVFLAQPGNGTAGQPITPTVRIAVQDPWGAPLVNLNESGTLIVSVEGTALASAHDIVDGIAELPGLSFPIAGASLKLRASRMGSKAAISAPFDLAP